MPNQIQLQTEQDNLAAANAQAEKIEIERKAKEAVKNKTIVSDIFNLLKEADLDSSESKAAIRNIANLYNEDKMTHLLTTMMMFLKKNILSERSFSWLKLSMVVIESVFNITSALFGKGLLNSFNLDKLMDFPLLKGLSNIFSSMESKGDSLDQNVFDDAIETAKSLGNTFVRGINADNQSSSVPESLIRTATIGIKGDDVINGVLESEFAQKIGEKFTQLRDNTLDAAATTVKKVIKEEICQEEVKEFIKNNAAEMLTPEVRQAAMEIAGDAIKDTMSSTYESGVKSLSDGLSYLGSNAYSGISSLLGNIGLWNTKAQPKVETEVENDHEKTAVQQNIL